MLLIPPSPPTASIPDSPLQGLQRGKCVLNWHRKFTLALMHFKNKTHTQTTAGCMGAERGGRA